MRQKREENDNMIQDKFSVNWQLITCKINWKYEVTGVEFFYLHITMKNLTLNSISKKPKSKIGPV